MSSSESGNDVDEDNDIANTNSNSGVFKLSSLLVKRAVPVSLGYVCISLNVS